jgi:hypothetical protein
MMVHYPKYPVINAMNWNQPDVSRPPSASLAGSIEVIVGGIVLDRKDYRRRENGAIGGDMIERVGGILNAALKETGGVVDGGRIQPRIAAGESQLSIDVEFELGSMSR